METGRAREIREMCSEKVRELSRVTFRFQTLDEKEKSANFSDKLRKLLKLMRGTNPDKLSFRMSKK